ncbi:agmatine deiminase family protein [Crossiella cryophila]|uniref:Agmatine deiminase n=1 Tax=Crossiella cryophila TaxID=43355 RepID=A0A7W7CIE6_9PSEU|nr:agmatine deiminase family protein [Crossiella cryophila]MBB4681779.1 agmatine deiminase [Crossiella cryophila]
MSPNSQNTAQGPPWRMPAEWEPHARTHLSWPAHTSLYRTDLPAVRAAVARLARAIAEHEPVALLARPEQQAAARQAVGGAVEVLPIPVDDLWTRDHGPTFVRRPGEVAGVDFGFNGWGEKQRPHDDDHRVPRRLLGHLGLPRQAAPIVAEGGSLEVDGEGTLLATESSLINDNRNPGRGKEDIEAVLGALLGVRKVIWLAGLRGGDITDCHVDGLARFTAPGVVLLNRPATGAPPDEWTAVCEEALKSLQAATDAQGRAIEVVELPEPERSRIRGSGDFLATYLNYYVANGAVFAPKFGDRLADDHARGLLAELHPGRTVVQLDIDPIAYYGGGIHCATQQEPAMTM